MWRTDGLTKKIIDVLVDDIDYYNDCEAKARVDQIKSTFNFNKFAQSMKDQLTKQRKIVAEEEQTLKRTDHSLNAQEEQKDHNHLTIVAQESTSKLKQGNRRTSSG